MSEDLFPGQSERVRFTADQMKCLASPARAEVFWNFHNTFPKSTAEVAEGLGRSASSTSYHVAELVQAGLLLAVGERKKRSRHEALYVLSSKHFSTVSHQESDDYRTNMLKGYAGLLRLLLRERTEFTEAMKARPQMLEHSAFFRNTLRMSNEAAKELVQRISAEIARATEEQTEQEGSLVAITFSVTPALVETRRMNRKGVKKPNKKG